MRQTIDMRILVTNDDGIDSVGLHVLARAMKPFGDVVIAAPDQEYSGAGAAIAGHGQEPGSEDRATGSAHRQIEADAVRAILGEDRPRDRAA